MLQPHLLKEIPHSKDCVHGRVCLVCGILGLKGNTVPAYLLCDLFQWTQAGKAQELLSAGMSLAWLDLSWPEPVPHQHGCTWALCLAALCLIFLHLSRGKHVVKEASRSHPPQLLS